MNLRRALRRFVTGDVSVALTPESEFAAVDPVDQTDPAIAPAEGGLLGCYARRMQSRPVMHETVAPLQTLPIGRGTPEHESAVAIAHATECTPEGERRRLPRRARPATQDSIRQRLIAAGLAVLLCVVAFPGGAHAQQRYRVQPGDTLASVAAEFGVDPEAILRSSWLSNPPELTPGDVIIIPDPGQSPDEAAAVAAAIEGTSPWTAGVYVVVEGDTIEEIAASYGVDPGEMLELNGLTWDDYIYPGQRLLIPGNGETDQATAEVAAGIAPYPNTSVWVPTHRQEHSLSCEYASVFIATSGLGYGIPESVFIDAIPVTANPHDGYRGDIDGPWGGYDDYGIYAEPLVPILNDYGFSAEIFYSDGDPAPLKAHLDAGQPVIVWLALWGDTGRVYHDAGRYTVFAGDHVMTAYGYDDDYVYLSDPGSGMYRAIDWGTFLWMWGTIDGMSLAISV